MLSDRFYMRERSGYSAWSITVGLMIVLVVCFAMQQINYVYIRKPDYEFYLALSPDGLRSGFIWLLMTYMFLHGGLWHLAANLIGLWFFGRIVENMLGWWKFLVIYFASGIFGGILQGVLGIAFPDYFGYPVYGASAGVFGILAVFCLIQSENEILLFMILPLKALYLYYISLGVALFFTIVPSDPSIAHAAHLGGLLVGTAFIKLGMHREFFSFDFGALLKPFKKTPGPKVTTVDFRGKKSGDAGSGEFISKEVDPILEKISAHGLQSLTEAERRILEAARQKMGKK